MSRLNHASSPISSSTSTSGRCSPWGPATVLGVIITKAYFMLPVGDMDRAVSFYRDVLSLEVKFGSRQWTELAWRDATIALHAGGNDEERESWLGFEVDDVETAVAAIEAAGGRRGDERSEAGTRLIAVTDTEGNALTIGQQPSWG